MTEFTANTWLAVHAKVLSPSLLAGSLLPKFSCRFVGNGKIDQKNLALVDCSPARGIDVDQSAPQLRSWRRNVGCFVSEGPAIGPEGDISDGEARLDTIYKSRARARTRIPRGTADFDVDEIGLITLAYYTHEATGAP
jgi:hypothetical protein